MKNATTLGTFEPERAARRAAEHRRASFETALCSVGDAVVAADANGRVTLMNPAAERLTGWPERDARGRLLGEVFSVVDERTREPLDCPVEKVLRNKAPVGPASHEVLVSRDRTRATLVEESCVPVRGPQGDIEGVVVVFRDVGQRRRDEARRAILREAAMALSECLDHEAMLTKVARLVVPDVADLCTVDLCLEGAPPSKQFVAAHADPAKLRYARELRAKYPPHPDDSGGVGRVLRAGAAELYEDFSYTVLEACAQDAEHLRLLSLLQLRSAMIVPLIARAKVLGAMTFAYAESDRRYGRDDLEFAEMLAERCAVAVDNTRLYAAEVCARRGATLASEAKNRFLAAVSHELRTPLTAIMGWTKLLASPALDEERKGRALRTIERNAVAMAELIDDLLDTSRGAGGRLRLERQIVDLADVLQTAVTSTRPAADAKSIRTALSIAADGVVLIGDSGRLQQVFLNLLSNAVKFTPQGGSVDVKLVRKRSSAEISVTDSGRGIAPNFLPYIFDPFRQDASHRSSARSGLGLGLAIARHLLELHGGQIAAESEGEGRGATFRVTLPVPVSAAEERSEEWRSGGARRAATPCDLSGVRALVVDDQNGFRDLIRKILEMCGADVETAANVDQAMESIARRVPDVLISDIAMPRQDGYDLIRKVRQLPPHRGGSVPAAALSGYARTEDRRRALDAGYSMHLAKPIEAAELIDVVASLTGFSLAP